MNRRLVRSGFVFGGGSRSSGTLMVAQSVIELSQAADSVVIGTVTSRAALISEDGRLIQTVVEVKVDQTLKGRPEVDISVAHPGGTLGDVSQIVDGSPSFAVGERVLLFLGRLPSEKPIYFVKGMSQGKFTLTEGGSKTVLALQDTRGAFIRSGLTITRGSAVVRPLTELMSDIKSIVGR